MVKQSTAKTGLSAQDDSFGTGNGQLGSQDAKLFKLCHSFRSFLQKAPERKTNRTTKKNDEKSSRTASACLFSLTRAREWDSEKLFVPVRAS